MVSELRVFILEYSEIRSFLICRIIYLSVASTLWYRKLKSVVKVVLWLRL